MSLKLYCDLFSQPCRAVYIFLKVTNIPFENIPVSVTEGGNLKDVFKTDSKYQSVPVLDDNGFKIMESTAILRYLIREKSVGSHWYPKDSKAQARVDEYMAWQHHNTRFLCNFFVQRKYLMPLKTGVPTSEHLVNESKERLLNCLEKIETLWLDRSKFIAGDKITVADLLATCDLEQTRIAGFDPTAEFPLLAQWMKEVKNFTNPHFDDAHKDLYQVMAKNKI